MAAFLFDGTGDGGYTGQPGAEKPELYQSILVNPADNKRHLPEDYIGDILDMLPEKQKARFRDGL
ncbi:MAG: hypothetical protein LBK74_08075 [Treponema sp.]|nr:hypothetical protein [Treponema sp.]